MNNPEISGSCPFHVVLVHGGPGVQGDLSELTSLLSSDLKVFEPYQTKNSIEEQLSELKSSIESHTSGKIILIGHSWGAWLSYIFSSRFPELVEKLFLISAAPFEEKYVKEIVKIRMNRLSIDEKDDLSSINELLNSDIESIRNHAFERLANIMTKTDSFDLKSIVNKERKYNADIFKNIWTEASELRKKGYLLKIRKKIKCPVIAIHGDHDPHPWQGVVEPLDGFINNFKFILLEKCGHYPWLEKNAADKFIEILKNKI